MCAWTHRADGKPISKNFQDRADYMKSGTAKIDIKKEHFRIQDSVSDPTAHSVVMATDKLIDNVPLTDQRGGPVTQLQLKDNETASTAALAAEVVARTAADTSIESNKVTTNTEQTITAMKTFAYASTAVAPAEDVAYEWKSVSEGRTAVEELMYMYDHWPKEVDIALEGLGTDIKEMCALAAEDPEAYYTMRNEAGYGDENGCFWGELPEIIDIPENSTSDTTEIDNEGLRVSRVDETVGARGSDIAAGELGVMSEDTNDFRSGITLRSPNIYDTTVLGLHEPEVHVTSKVNDTQVQRYFTFPTSGGVIATQPKAWELLEEFNAENPITDAVEYPLDLSGKSEIIFGVLGVGSGAATIDEETNEENVVNLTGYFMWDSDFDDGGSYTTGAGRNSSTAMFNAIEGATTTRTCCGIGHFWDIGIGVSSTGAKGYYNPILTAPQNSYGSGINGSGNHCHLLFGKNISNITGIKFYGAAAISADNYWHIRIYAR